MARREIGAGVASNYAEHYAGVHEVTLTNLIEVIAVLVYRHGRSPQQYRSKLLRIKPRRSLARSRARLLAAVPSLVFRT